MAFQELRGLQREMYLKAKIDELAHLYRKSQRKLTKYLQEVTITEFQRYRTEAILKQINQEVKILSNGCYKWVKDTIPYAYTRGIDLSAERLKALKVTRFVNYDAQIHTSALNVLIDDITLDLISANESMKKVMVRYIRTTQQRILEEKQISKMLAEGIIEGEARKEVSDKLLLKFKSRMANEQLIHINGKYYRPDKYAQLLARTRVREATTQGSVNTALHYGVDLMQVSVHANSCPYCMQFQGRIYSISGKHPDFPVLEERPPYHPNCEHVLVPITQESIEGRGYYDSAVKLSNSPATRVDSFKRFEELIGVM